MKISFLVDVINEKSGARAPIKIASGLARLGESVTLFSYPDQKDPAVEGKLRKLGIKVVYVGGLRKRAGKFLAAKDLLEPLRKAEPEIISCHSSYPFFFAAKLVGKPIIYTYYGTQLTKFDQATESETGLHSSALQKLRMKTADRIITALENRRMKLADRTLGISKSTVEEASRLYKQKIDYIYLGAEIDDKKFLEIKKSNDELLLLTISRIVPYKGFHRVLTAFNNIKPEFPNSKLIMIGSNYHPRYLDFLKGKLQGSAEIILSPSDSELLGYYQDCDIYLSGTSWEGFGLPFLEAEGLGKPVLGFQNTSLPEVVEDGETGFLASSQADFEKKLRKLAGDKTLRQTMGKRGVEFAKKFAWEKTAREYQKYFKNFMEKKL
jgi:glycosyltransferase involved in cell wall biosynthesis